MSPVKECALQHDIPVLQPVKIKQAEEIERLRQYEADVYVVAAFGQILSQEILDLPRYGSLCIHASLLPAYRGASPINRVIMDGQKKSGVTIMQMDPGIEYAPGQEYSPRTCLSMESALWFQSICPIALVRSFA